MKKVLVTALILCWSASVHAGMSGASFFKSLMSSPEKKSQNSSSGSTDQGSGDNSDSKAGSDGAGNDGNQGNGDNAGIDQGRVSANDWDVSWGTKTPGMFLTELPNVPGSGCEDSGKIVEKFGNMLRPIAKELNDNVAKRRRAMKKWNDKNSKRMMENAVDMPGFEGKSQAEMKKMAKAERKKMAEKMMEDKYGISMDDLKKQKKAQREGKPMANVDFAKTMPGEQQANDLMKSKSQVEADKRKIANAGKLAKEQAELSKEVLGLRGRYNNKVVELENDRTGLGLKKEIEKEEKTLDEMQSDGRSTCKDLDGQRKAVVNRQKLYCSFMSDRYLKILQDYKVSIQIVLPKHDRLDQVASEIQKNQLGVGLSNASKGLNGLETVQDYARLLAGAYTYNLGAQDKEHPFSYCDGDAGTISP